MDRLGRALIGVIAGFILVGVQTGAWAQMPGHPPMGKGGMGMGGGMKGHSPMSSQPGHQGMFSMGFFQEELGLSPEQIQKFKKLRGEYEKESIRRKADIRIAEIELWDVVEKADSTPQQIEQKVREVQGKKTDLRVFRFKHMGTLKTILTPEQFEKFRTMGFMMFGGGRYKSGGMGMKGGMGGGGGYGGGYGDHGSDED